LVLFFRINDVNIHIDPLADHCEYAKSKTSDFAYRKLEEKNGIKIGRLSGIVPILDASDEK